MIRTVCIMMTARELKEKLDAGKLPEILMPKKGGVIKRDDIVCWLSGHGV